MGRGGWVVVLVLALLLAACRGGGAPDLVVPTAAMTASIPTAEPTTAAELPTAVASIIPPTPTSVAPTPTSEATATLPAAPTVAPPLPTTDPSQATATPSATAVPPSPTPEPPTVTPEPAAEESGYRVAFVADDDTLNVRNQPNTNADIVARLSPDAGGIEVIDDEGQTFRGSVWLPIETAEGEGWVNSRFLTESVSREAFCADPAVSELISQFERAVAEQDGRALRGLIHPDRGLRLRLNWWNEEVVVAWDDAQGLFRAQQRYDWGTEEGSGEAIRGSFRDVVLPRLERDLLGASEWGCDEGLFGGTAGLTVLPEGYDAVRYFSVHRPAPAEQEFDWGTWLIGVERWEGNYYLSYLVHYRWEI